jgi:hypothetical protein
VKRDSVKNVTISNLTLKYGGAHGIGVGEVSGWKITGCEIGWIGGGILSGTTRYGNGIELWDGAKDCVIENNYVYQCYDSGISNQSLGGDTDNPAMVDNVIWRNNLVEYTTCAYEYWITDTPAGAIMKNVLFEGNLLRFTGYGWGVQRVPRQGELAVGSSVGYNPAQNYVFKNNTFDLCHNMLFDIRATRESSLPTFSGNTYIQPAGWLLGEYKGLARIVNNSGAQALVRQFDKTGVVKTCAAPE